jgi:hypothetical protein
MKDYIYNEIWKKLSIPNLDPSEKYQISNYGRIKSYKKNPSGYIIKNTVLKGYQALVVKLKNRKNTTKYIHKLVAEHFLLKESTLQKYVIHLDFNKDNNHESNLLWVTRQTMFAHQKINPNYKRGFICNAKLTEDKVLDLKLKLIRGEKKANLLAKEFGITHTQLNRIKRGENWANVKVEVD